MRTTKTRADYWVRHYSRKLVAYAQGRLLIPDSYVRFFCRMAILWSKACR